ncbi:MAG: hypothetical protein ABSG41_13775 [Bryobacteraceae bacterium]|jgi:acetamidase/formamidase
MLERLQVGVVKGKKIRWPRFESNDSILAAGAYWGIDDVMRIALTRLIGCIHDDCGLSGLDVYELRRPEFGGGRIDRQEVSASEKEVSEIWACSSLFKMLVADAHVMSS